MRVLRRFATLGDPLFWQTTDKGEYTGLGTGLDLDQFMGDQSALDALRVVAVQTIKVVLPGGNVCACDPQWAGDRITVSALPLLTALGLPQNNPAVHPDTGRAFVGSPDGLADYSAPWVFYYRDTAQGPRVYCKKVTAK